MCIYVTSLSGNTLTMYMRLSDSVAKLKRMVLDREGVPPHEQRLIFAGAHLEDIRTLRDYNIQPQSTLHLVLRLRGGGPKQAPKRKIPGILPIPEYTQAFGPSRHGACGGGQRPLAR